MKMFGEEDDSVVHCQAEQGKEVRVHVKRYVKIDSKNNYTIRSLPVVYLF